MKITLNGIPTQVAGPSLADVLDQTGHAGAKVATAVNERFVSAATRADTPIHPGDRIEIVAPRQGG